MKAAIFDLDGTLVESLPGLTTALNQLLADLDLPPQTEPQVRSYIGDGQWMLIRRALPDFSKEQIDDLQPAFQKHYQTAWPTGTVIFDGVREMLLELKTAGVQLGVLSNKKHPFTVEIVETLFGRELIPLIYGQREGIPIKPDPSALIAISEETGISPAEICYIGDSTIDLVTAQGAKTQGLGVTWGYHDRPHLERYGFPLCDTVDELRAALLSI